MNLAFALALCAALPASSAENFAFQNGTLAGWEGEGYTIAPAGPRGPGLAFAVCSGDNGPEGKTATLHRAFTVPAAGGYLRCFAHAVRSPNCPPNENLDVVVFAAGKRILPKMVRINADLKPVANLLGPHKGRSREYVWDLTSHAGQSLRIVMIDQDKRRDCFVVCSGFAIIPADDFESREFGRFMHRLTAEHKLAPAARYESPHFIAYSNADESFTSLRLGNCELIYELFFDHFRKHGFAVRPPLTKMMVAVFETHAGFLAYYGDKLPDGVTGLYHPKTNRLLVYDYGTNREFTDIKRAVKDRARSIGNDLDRRRYIDSFTRKAAEYRTETNISTIMHEVAHQLSFNCGLLNREGDVPFWLAEGLACYCESTDNGAWQGIGEHNPERLQALQVQVQGRGPLIPLQQLIERDDFMRDQRLAILAYSQSWALFKMLIEERPQQLRRYLALIHNRRVSGARLGDFTQAFGSDLSRLDLRYQEYIREMVDRYGTKKR